MRRSALAAALVAILVPTVAHGGLCDAAKLKAASSFAACRGKADGLWLKTGDAAKRDALYAKCNDALVKGYGAAELRYGMACPTAGDVDAVKKYLTQCTGDTYDSTQPGGTVPDYVADLAACSGDLATARAGTATASDVAKGKTFTSAAGLGLTGTAYANGLLKTGQTTSYGVGSDGNLQRGAPRSFTDNGDGTVTDDRTGLVWEKKSDDGSIHDKDDTYTWWSGVQTIVPYAMNGTMVNGFLSTLNTAPCFAGHCDWRIPNIRELESLVNYEAFGPATFSAFNTGVFNSGCFAGCTVLTCSCTVSGFYWSSSTLSYGPNYAWGLSFNSGEIGQYTKWGVDYVRAVRGGS